MTSPENDIGEKIRAVVTALGERRKYNEYLFVGDVNCLMENVEEWSKEIGKLSIDCIIKIGRDCSEQLLRVRQRRFLFPKTMYLNEDGKVTRYVSGGWEEEINKHYQKAIKMQKLGEGMEQAKKNIKI